MQLTAAKITKTKLGENLQALLATHKISEGELAQRLELPVMTIRRISSGETADPRISTLKLIANHFNVTLDSLVDGNHSFSVGISGSNKPHFVPILDWEKAASITSITELDLRMWQDWQPITLNIDAPISERAYALESRRSMHPRFPTGTLFIIDPEITPVDGDMILLRVKDSSDLTLKELFIDPPERQLHPIAQGSSILPFTDDYTVVGVVVLTLFYNRKSFAKG